jgi:hypothetical protein
MVDPRARARDRDQTASADAVAQLRGEGLLHQLGYFVFASRAAVNMDRLNL